MEELIGQQLGTYTIERMLGRGGMAAVFLAHDAAMERKVAIKVLPREFASDPAYVKRFEREVKTIARLNHPNIVPVHAFGEENGYTYIVMAHMPGGTLHGRIRKMGSSTPLETIASYMDQIGSAVDYAHAQGIIHRDFKPANVLVGETGHLSLSDFGIAKMTESTAHLTGTGMLGTPAYMAPELANQGGLTKLVDVYAVATTLYELVTGNLPYNADTPMGMLMAHMNTPVPDARYFRTDLPDGLQDVIQRGMAKDPAQRYQSAGEMAADLRYAFGMAPLAEGPGTEMIDDGSTVSTPRPRTPPRATEARSAGADSTRPKLPIALIGGAAAAVVAIIIGALALSGAFSPQASGAPTSTDDQPTAVVNATPTEGSLQPNARILLGSADFRTSNSGDFQPLAGSETLAIGAAIRMGADGVGVLTFAPGVSVEVQPGAVVSIQRIEVVGDTLFVELTQESGTTYHFIGEDAGGLKRDYMVHTPHGTIKAVGTEFWVDEAPEGWYFIPAVGTTTFAHNDSADPSDQYVEHASTGDCLLVDTSSNVTNCANLPGLTLRTDGSNLKATDTPTPVVDAGPSTGPATATACAEKYYCSKDPNQKGTLIHEKADCTVELLPGNPQCAGDLGGPAQPPPGCGNCGDGGSDLYSGDCGTTFCPYSCEYWEALYDLCSNYCSDRFAFCA